MSIDLGEVDWPAVARANSLKPLRAPPISTA